MGDWITFAKARRQLRQVFKSMHEVVHGLKLKPALGQTLIGRIQKGFDFLGYRLNASGLCGLARKTIDNHMNKRLRLDEQNAPDQRVQATIGSWQRWARTEISPAVVGGLWRHATFSNPARRVR